uniref:Uncharacterized protein n=1 Tax=Plectus sambesii TaxID=2011161 RepID=A0A914WDW7_9BILA
MSAWRGGGAYPGGHFAPAQQQYHGDELSNPIMRMPLGAPSVGAPMHPDQRRLGVLPLGPAEMFVQPHRPVAATRPVPPPATGLVVYKVNQSKSLPSDIQSILVNASRAGNLSAANGFKLRAYYENLSNSVKITFYQHMVKFLGVGDADLIADRPALIPPKKPSLPDSATQMASYSGDDIYNDNDDGTGDCDDSIDIDLTPTAGASSTPVALNGGRLQPLIVPTKVHSIDRKYKALERQREKIRAMPKAHHDNVMDYKADELPGVTFDKDGKATFNGFTVRWIRQMLYILYRNGKGGDKGADQFLKLMEEYYGPDVIKQVNPEKQMTRLQHAAEKAGKEIVPPSTPEEAAKKEEIKRLHRITHNLKLETVVGLNGNETRCGLTPETVAWIRENVLAMLRVHMNPDKFLRRIGGMFGLPAMDIAWADKPFAVAMQKLIPEMPEEEKPVKLLKLATAAYRKAFGTVLAGMDTNVAAEEDAEEVQSARLTEQSVRHSLPRWEPPGPPMSHPLPAPLLPPPNRYGPPHAGPEYDFFAPHPPFGHGPPQPSFGYDYPYHPRMPNAPGPRAPLPPEYRDYSAAHYRHQPYPAGGGNSNAGRPQAPRGKSGRALHI